VTFAQPFLDWYAANHRPLPWRATTANVNCGCVGSGDAAGVGGPWRFDVDYLN
jgi:adenine-specific DNA glycosylase